MIEDVQHFPEFYNIAEFAGETAWPTNWVVLPQEGQRYYTSDLVPKLLDKKYTGC